MSRRNLILLIIVLVIAIIAFFGFLFSRPSGTTPGGNNTGTNFISQFNPFGNGTTTKPPIVTPPVDISGNQPNPPTQTNAKLIKVSSMPIAGFTVYTKERLKDMPVVAPTTAPIIPYDFGITTLKNGSTSEAVKEIQRFLNDTFKLSFKLDGVLSTEIITAIKQWQSDHGLVADGVVGAKTKALMYSSVNQKTGTTNPTPPLTEFMPALRYVDRATGNVYQTFADKIEERKFSGTVIPQIYEALFGNKGLSVVMRYLKGNGRTIETFVGNLPKELLGADTTVPNEIKGTFLPENIKDISLSPDTSSIFYLFNSGDNMIGTTMNLTTNKKVQIFTSPFTEWLSQWGNTATVSLTTKPSSGIPGYMYMVNSNTKSLTSIFGNINGLTTLTSPSGKLVLYGNDSLSISVYHTDTKVSNPLGVRTLPEKCVWGNTSDVIFCSVPKLIDVGQYPDVWYQGEVSFRDQIWKIDLKTGNTTMLVDPFTISNGEEIDGTKLMMDDGENYLFFVNKKDSFLWEFTLK